MKDEFFSLPLFPQASCAFETLGNCGSTATVSAANGGCYTCGTTTATGGASTCSNCGTTCLSGSGSLCPRCGCAMTSIS